MLPAPTMPAMSMAPQATINVQLMDYAITLDSSMAKAGMVMFVVHNNGPSPHTFHVKVGNEEIGTQAVPPGQTAMLMLSLTPGTYSYRCIIGPHSILGMQGMLTVV